MRDFEGKVAVVTGAASGIGFGLAERFAQEGMKVVLADVEEKALDEAVQVLRGKEHDVIGVVTDVRRAEQIEALAARTIETYGKVHVLCNNAGVAAGAPNTWEYSLHDWEWVMGVNIMGVVHGVHTFLPIMLKQDEEGHVVNTSSVWGLVSRGGTLYGVSKFAVMRYTEGLYNDLRTQGARVSCSVLCPGAVATKIALAGRNRPAELVNPNVPTLSEVEEEERRAATIARWREIGMPPAQVAGIVLDAIKDDRFYILTHPGVLAGVSIRMEDILNQRNPSPQDFSMTLSAPGTTIPSSTGPGNPGTRAQ